MPRTRAASKQPVAAPGDPEQAASNPGLHRGKCSICRHPRRAEIEQEFLDYTNAREIARFYRLPSHTTVYRHARAMRLFERRVHNLRAALDRIIEHAGEVEPSAGNVIAAVALMAKINEQGQWAAGDGPMGFLRASDQTIWEKIQAEEEQQ